MGKEEKQQAKVEKTLKDIHVLFANSEAYNGDKDKIIVDKKKLFGYLEQINRCMYEMMDIYEITATSRERELRKTREKGEQIIAESNRIAEDIYSAAVIYTDDALKEVYNRVALAKSEIASRAVAMTEEIDEQLDSIVNNHEELRQQLMDLHESEKYLKIIERENKAKAQEEDSDDQESTFGKLTDYTPFTEPENWYEEPIRIMAPTPEIHIDPAFAEDAVLDDFEEGVVEKTAPTVTVNMDSAYFKMKAAQAGFSDDDFQEGVIDPATGDIQQVDLEDDQPHEEKKGKKFLFGLMSNGED